MASPSPGSDISPEYIRHIFLSKSSDEEHLKRLVPILKDINTYLTNEEVDDDTVGLLLHIFAQACSSKLQSSRNDVLTLLLFLSTSSILDKRGAELLLRKPDGEHPFQCILTDLATLLQTLNMITPASILTAQKIGLITLLQKQICENEQMNDEIEIKDAIKDLQSNLLVRLAEKSEARKKDKNQRELKEDKWKPPEDFRKLSVMPEESDLLYATVFLRRNKRVGRYNDLDHYLDVQFRLYREDCIVPLREAYEEFLTKDKEHRNFRLESGRLYRDIQILKGTSTSPEHGEVFVVEINKEHRKRIRWNNSRRLTFGSLLIMSFDRFKTKIFAVVSDSDPERLRNEGLFKVKIYRTFNNQQIPRETKGIIIEATSAYFESYVHVLKALQSINDYLPFQRYVVECNEEISLPRYLAKQPEALYSIELNRIIRIPVHQRRRYGNFARDEFKERKVVSKVEVVDINKWPSSKDLGMDESQRQAFISALTREFVLIQGPPGTGKTYLGLQIAKCLLMNTEIWRETPIFNPELRKKPCLLVVCYTNHALDQFIEGIINFLPQKDKIERREIPEVIRIGSRCKNETVEKFSIKNFRYIISRDRENQETIIGKAEAAKKHVLRIRAVLKAIQSKKVVVHFWNMKPYMLNFHVEQFTRDSSNIWYDWLQASPGKWCEECQKPKQLKKRTTRETRREENEKQGEIDKMFESEVNERTLDDDTEYQLDMNIVGIDLELQLKQMLDTIPDETYQERLRNEAQITFDFLQDGEVVSENKMQSQAKLGKRNIKERWGMYHYWLNRFVEALKQTLHEKEEEYNKIFEEYRTARLEIDEEILKRTSVIAITTTGAAKYHDSLMKIGPQITIIEEAAEVPESHIVTAINPDCEHLILIGDHKQLEPKPAVIELATRYNLSISLFERMLNNGLHYNCLQRQHRMRPEISNLVRHMYPVLEDNENVLEYDNVKGVGHNLFFITHDYPEEFNEDNRSYSSEHEAEYIKELCRYILKQGYLPTEITIIAAYTGQMLLLRNKMLRSEFDGVNISVLDNYQGEENEIIILSLVRSNTRGDIGFLRRENRICVALSRAKKGLYILGNSSTLIQQSEEWKIVIDKIQTTKSNGEEVCLLGKALPLYCQNHPETKILAESSYDFAKAPDGGCELKCQLRLDCGHSCRLFCHPYDQEHKEYACRSTCNKRCPEEHVCAKTCHFPKDCKCSVMMNRDLHCGHSAYLQCHVNTLEYKCLTKVERELDCGHIVSLSCHVDYEDYDCKVIVSDIRDDCGHSFERECHDELYGRLHKCNVVVEKEFPLCKHTKHLKCYEPIQYHKCEKPISKKLDCGHTHIKSCHEWRFRSHTCREKCENVCPNDHICQKPCHHPLPCDCQVKMVKKIPKCGHYVKMACSESVVNYKDCDQRVDIVLKICGHTVEGRCREKFQIEESGKSTKPELEIAMKCQQKAKVQLPKCKHILEVKCWKKMDMLRYWEGLLLSGNVSIPHRLEKTCTGSVTIELRCGHTAKTECWKKEEYETSSVEDCLSGKANVKCSQKVYLKQFCEHNIEVECWEKHRYEKEVNLSTRLNVFSPLRRYARLRHVRLVEELDIRCSSVVDLKLPCGHMKSVRCWEKYIYEARHETRYEFYSGISFDLTKQIPELKCETKVKIELPVCGHVIAVKCCEKERFKPSEVKCSELVTYVYDHCTHSIQVQCYEHPRHASRLSLTRQKHSMPPCQAEITKELECGHDVTCKCSESKFIKCSNDCSKRMGCGHMCTGKCEVCFTNLTHKECINVCNKSLFCGHKCKSKKCMKCVRCDMKCMFKCAHVKCRQKCIEPCIACSLPCDWECEHYKCTEICSKPCNRPRCNDNCKNILSCGHFCSGFCSEPCPRACIKCDDQSFSNVDENDSKTVTITDCGHSFGYQYLDLYMEAKASNIIARCPTCQNVFYWHPRYDTILKTKKVFTEEIKHILAEKFKGLKYNYFPICDADVFRHFNAYIEKFLAFLQLNRYIVTDAGDMGAVNNFQVFGIRLMNVMQKTNTNSFQNFQNISDELFNVYVMWIEVLLGRNENLSNINLKIKHKAPINNSTASSALALHADVQNVNENNDQTLFSIEIDALSGQEVVSKLKEYRQKCKKDRLMRLLSELKRFIIDDPHAVDAMKYPVLSNVHVVGIHEADWFICSKGHVVPAVVSDDCFICSEGDDVKAWIQKFEPNFQSNEHFKKVETDTPKGRKRGKKNRKSNNETERESGSQLLFPGVSNGTDTDTTKREQPQQQPINFLDSILNPQQAPTRNFNPNAHRGRFRGGQHISTSRDRRTQHQQTSSPSSGGFQFRGELGRDSPSVERNDRESSERWGIEQRRGRGRGERGRGGNERGGRGRGRGEYNERGGRGSGRGNRGGRGTGGGEFSDRGGRGRGGGEFSDRGGRGRSGRGERGGRGRTGRGGGRNRR